MMFIFILLLVSNGFAQREEDCFQSWYYIENPTQEQEQQALNGGCFHGTYGSISLLTCEIEGSEHLSDEYCSAKLCVVETPRSEELLEKITEDNRKDTEVLLSIGNSHVLSSESYSCLDLDINRENVNIITVSEDAWIPVSRKPSSFVFNLTAPDPFIETVLKSVDPKRMHDYIVALANIHTRQSASSGAREAQDYLQRTYTSFGFNAYTHQYRTDWSSNVIAEIRGTQYPDEIVIVGAHYDSRGPDRASTTQRAPGADDNASGTSNLLEFATIIRQQNIKFARTLRLTSFSGEEQGLVGSRAYAQSIATKVPRDNVIAYLNGDMLGWRVPNQNIIMAMMTRFVDQTLVDNCNQITRTYVPSLALGISTGCCSDQQSFAENGFPAAGYFENPFGASSYPHYHQSTDLPQYINVEQLGLEGTAIMAAALTYAGAYRG